MQRGRGEEVVMAVWKHYNVLLVHVGVTVLWWTRSHRLFVVDFLRFILDTLTQTITRPSSQ